MRRFRRKKDEDDEDVLTFDDLEDEEEEERPRRRRRYAPPRPMKVTRFSDYEEEDEEAPDHDDLEAKVRAGSYKPKRSDPWTIHVLYNLLVESGKIQE